MGWVAAVQVVVQLKIFKEGAPLVDEALHNINPHPLDSHIVDTLTPNLRAPAEASELLHHPGDNQVFNPMIATDATGVSSDLDDMGKEFAYSLSPIVVAGANAKHKAGIAINKCVENNLPVDQACIL